MPNKHPGLGVPRHREDRDRLTQKEQALLEAWAVHGNYKDICEATGINLLYARKRMGQVRDKIGVKDNAEAVIIAKSRGLLNK